MESRVGDPPALLPYYKLVKREVDSKMKCNPHHDPYELHAAKPGCFSRLHLLYHFIIYPLKAIMWVTMPNPEGSKASLTLFISIAWVAALAYLASWWLVTFCCAYEAPTFLVGVLAVPWLIAFREFEHFRQIAAYFRELSQRGIRAHNAKFGRGFRFEEQGAGERLQLGGGRFQGDQFDQHGPTRMLKPTLSDLRIGLYESYPAVIMQMTLGFGLVWLIYTIFVGSTVQTTARGVATHFLLLLGLIWGKLGLSAFTRCVVGKATAGLLLGVYVVYVCVTVLVGQGVLGW